MRYFPKKSNHIVVDSQQGLATTLTRQPSLVDEFYFDESKSVVDGSKVIACHNPLYMLFNQQRLDRLGSDSVRAWIEQLNQSQHSSINSILQKCSDDDLLRMVKSRHIQHPAELERYITDLDNRAEKFNSEVARVRAQMEFDEQQKKNDQPLNTE